METFQDSNCCSLSDNFSLYERYMRSFKVGDHLSENNPNRDLYGPPPINSPNPDSRSNVDLTVIQSNFVNKYNETAESNCYPNSATCDNIVDRVSSLDIDLCAKIDSPCNSLCTLSLENSSATIDKSLLQDKSNYTDVHISSEESKVVNKQPVFITPTMENSNNAVDSIPLFRYVRPSESVFKLPISELSFNGTIKHVKKLKPIVDPITAFSTSIQLETIDEKSRERVTSDNDSDDSKYCIKKGFTGGLVYLNMSEKISDCAKGSHPIDLVKKNIVVSEEETVPKWDSDQSYTSFDASFDSGVRSPDMFSDNDDNEDAKVVESEPFWSFLKDYETYEKKKVKKTEEILHGVLPPPSVTTLKTDVTEMLKKYYNFLPLFNDNSKVDVSEVNSVTPTKRVSYVEIPEQVIQPAIPHETVNEATCSTSNLEKETSKHILNTSHESDVNLDDNKSIELKTGTKEEALETSWPHVLKCKYHDVYYNVTKYSERYELLVLRYGERYVGAETDTSVNIYSGGLQSPNSASKRKDLRLKMAQAKSPGCRLSHLARRRQAFCSAATISEKAQTSTAKMVLIDRNFFPHRKFISSAERKSPRFRRTPGKRTPTRLTPGKKTPMKSPKTRSGGSSKKKAMRRLLLDSETITRTQPSRETLKRALFISPENRNSSQTPQSASVPSHTVKSRQRLFGSPVGPADTKSCDGSQSDQFLKRKLDALDYEPESSRSKIAKSLSFGGVNVNSMQSVAFGRRSSEAFTRSNTIELNDTHKQKLLWAVSEALRVHGWRMSSPGFREKASALARLTRRLLALPQHMAKLTAPKLSTSETMLKLARQYVFAIIQGRSVDDCYQEEQLKLANEANSKITGYISASAYQQLKTSQAAATSQIKENTRKDASNRLDQTKSGTKNVLQDKLVNIDANSNSSCGLSVFDRPSLGLFKSNSMPSFEEAAKLRVRRQISFDNANFPKSLMKKFYSIDPEKLQANHQHRFSKEEIINKFEVLKNNPYQDRIFQIFSSQQDECFSFEDLLDLCSAMSAECPTEVKAAWAFKIFDMDDDCQISSKDIYEILDRLTCNPNNRLDYLDKESKGKIAEVILDEMKLDSSGGIGLSEFKIIMSRLPEFESSFYFRL